MENIIKRLNSLYPLSGELHQHLQGILEPGELKKKGYLLKAGMVCQNIYFIRSGLLRCYYRQGDKEVSSWFVKENESILCIGSFYSQMPGNEFVQALENSEFLSISYVKMQQLFRQFPEFNNIWRLLVQQSQHDTSATLSAIRMRTARERYLWLRQNQPELLLRVPGKFLASYLDIAEVTFRKIRSHR